MDREIDRAGTGAGPHPDADSTLELFEHLVDELVERLRGHDDWGLSGLRRSQYRHDVVADEVMLAGLHEAGFAVLSEESGLTGDGSVAVVVDPIDGSTNAARGLPWFAASLCAVDDDGPWVALVANLASGERYRAIRGQGFERVPGVGERAGIGGVVDRLARPGLGPSSCRDLGDAVIGLSGLPPTQGGWRQFRVFGAAALDLCAVAVGRLDGYVDINRAHGPWDYLGAFLVCMEAGAHVVDSGGEGLVVLEHNARRGPIAAATPELLDQLMAMERAWR